MLSIKGREERVEEDGSDIVEKKETRDTINTFKHTKEIKLTLQEDTKMVRIDTAFISRINCALNLLGFSSVNCITNVGIRQKFIKAI